MAEILVKEKIYKSIDAAIIDNQTLMYSLELYYSPEQTEMPPLILKLKAEPPVMFLRSMESAKTTNETRCIVTRMHKNVIKATISCKP